METLSIYRKPINILKPHQNLETLPKKKPLKNVSLQGNHQKQGNQMQGNQMQGGIQMHGNQTQGNQIQGRQTELG